MPNLRGKPSNIEGKNHETNPIIHYSKIDITILKFMSKTWSYNKLEKYKKDSRINNTITAQRQPKIKQKQKYDKTNIAATSSFWTSDFPQVVTFHLHKLKKKLFPRRVVFFVFYVAVA